MDKQRLAEQLSRYLDQQYPGREGHTVTNLNEINMGWETELFTLEINWKQNGRRHREDGVLRVFSGGNAGKKANKEYSLMKELHEVGYPVPRVYKVDKTGDVLGKPFVLMERIMGPMLDEAYRNETPEQLQEGLDRLITLFVRLHSLDAARFKRIPGITYSGDPLKNMNSYFTEYLGTGQRWIEPVVAWLDENRPPTGRVGQSLLHMDYHGMNVLLREDGEASVIDWSAASIGDHRIDLGWTMLLYTTFGGAMYRDLILDTYSIVSGRRVEDIEYFEVTAATRRIIDFARTIQGYSVGLKPDIVDLMKDQKTHFIRVHDVLEARTGIRLAELDHLLDSI